MTLDRNGACCKGHLDACGVCNGDGTTIGISGSCCAGTLDAGRKQHDYPFDLRDWPPAWPYAGLQGRGLFGSPSCLQ